MRKLKSYALVRPDEHPDGAPDRLTLVFDNDTVETHIFGSAYSNPESHDFMVLLYELLKVGAIAPEESSSQSVKSFVKQLAG